MTHLRKSNPYVLVPLRGGGFGSWTNPISRSCDLPTLTQLLAWELQGSPEKKLFLTPSVGQVVFHNLALQEDFSFFSALIMGFSLTNSQAM